MRAAWHCAAHAAPLCACAANSWWSRGPDSCMLHDPGASWSLPAGARSQRRAASTQPRAPRARIGKPAGLAAQALELALQRGLLQLHVALVLDGRLQLGLGRRQALPARVRAQQRVAGARQTLRGSLPDRVAGTLRGRPMPLMTRVGPVARYSKSLAGARRSVQAQSVPQDERSARACQLRRALAGSWARGSTRPPCGNRRVVEDRARIIPSMQHGRTWSCPGPCACGRRPAGRPCSSSARCPAPP